MKDILNIVYGLRQPMTQKQTNMRYISSDTHTKGIIKECLDIMKKNTRWSWNLEPLA
jgi:hypothetical protein